MKNNYYQILGVKKNASFDEIKKAYRLLVFHFHPDRNINSDNELLEINEAYKVLSNMISRQKYDLSINDTDECKKVTPKLKWINDVIDRMSKPINGLSLSEAKGDKKDASNLMEYLLFCPIYELYSYDTNPSNTTYIHTMKRY